MPVHWDRHSLAERGESPTSASGRSLVGGEVSRNKRSPLCGAAPIEAAEGFDTVRSIVAARAWSALAARFALTNSPHFRLRRTAHCADIWLVCHVGTWVRLPPCQHKNPLPQGERVFVGGAYRFKSEPKFIFVKGIFGCIFLRNIA